MRNTRSARRLYQDLPSLWITDCSAAAIDLSLAWLYEMKASYATTALPFLQEITMYQSLGPY